MVDHSSSQSTQIFDTTSCADSFALQPARALSSIRLQSESHAARRPPVQELKTEGSDGGLSVPEMDSPLSPAARVAARVVFAGLPPAWLSTFDSSSSLDDDDDDDEALDGYDEDPFDDDPRRARRQYQFYARRRSARLSTYKEWVGAVRRASRERAAREAAREAAPLQRWRLPPPRRLRYRSGHLPAFTAFSCLAVAMGLAGAPYDPFEERYPDRKHREASWQKLAARYVSPVL